MELTKLDIVLECHIEDIYFTAASGSTPPLFSEILERIYNRLAEEFLSRRLDEAIERGEHELYGMGRNEFFNWFYIHDLPNAHVEPHLKIEELIELVKGYFIRFQFCVEMYYNDIVNAPLQEVW